MSVRRRVAAAVVATVVAASGSLPARAAAPDEVRTGSGLLALVRPVSCDRFATVAAWAGRHGYRFPAGEGVCRRGPESPAVSLGWNTAAVWADAWSEMAGLVPVYRDAAGRVARDAVSLSVVPVPAAGSDGYRLPTLAEQGEPRFRALMTRDIQEWTGTRIDLGDGMPYYYLCKPGTCDFHSSGTSGRGVGFRLVRVELPHG